MRERILEAIEREKIVGIIRGVAPNVIIKLSQALYDGGLRIIEVTFDQARPERHDDTVRAIRELRDYWKGQMYIGAGTVTSTALVEKASAAGAQFIVSPDTNEAVIRDTLAHGMVSIPGCLTPSEMTKAHSAGADFVKLFPAANLGSAFVKAIRSPLNHLHILAVGGINEKNMAEYLEAGCCGVGIGGNLCNRDWIASGQFERIRDVAAQLCAIVGRLHQ